MEVLVKWQWCRVWCSDSGEEDYSGVTVVEGPVVLQQCSATIWQWWRWWAWWRGLQCSDRGCQETNPTSVWHLWEFLEGGDNYHDKIIFPYYIISLQSKTLVLRLLWSWWQLWDFIIIIIVKSRDCTCKENLRDSWLLCKNVKTSKQYFIIEGNPLCRGISAYI